MTPKLYVAVLALEDSPSSLQQQLAPLVRAHVFNMGFRAGLAVSAVILMLGRM